MHQPAPSRPLAPGRLTRAPRPHGTDNPHAPHAPPAVRHAPHEPPASYVGLLCVPHAERPRTRWESGAARKRRQSGEPYLPSGISPFFIMVGTQVGSGASFCTQRAATQPERLASLNHRRLSWTFSLAAWQRSWTRAP